MTDPKPAESGSRVRTRTAILDAAVEALTADRQASMTEIAAAAHVGRTTVHRYFPERADLIRAVFHHVGERGQEAIRRAEPHSGPVRDAVRRVVEECMGFGPILVYLYSEPLLTAEPELENALRGMEEAVEEVLARPDAGLNSEFPRMWIRQAFWALLYAGWETAQTSEIPRHQIVEMILTTFTQGFYGPQDSEIQDHNSAP